MTTRSSPTRPRRSSTSYIADSSDAVWNDQGDLWAFVADGVDDYYDFGINSGMSVTGKFVKVPKDIATGRAPDGTDLMAADKGYPAAERRHLAARSGHQPRPRRPAMGAEHWGDAQPQRVFQFTRVEDIAYDRRPGMQNVVYVVDSGRGATSAGGQRVHVVERPCLEARARQERPDEGDVVLDPDRG